MELCVVALGSSGITDIVRGFADAATIITADALNAAMTGTRYKLVDGVHYGTSVPSNIADNELFYLIEG